MEAFYCLKTCWKMRAKRKAEAGTRLLYALLVLFLGFHEITTIADPAVCRAETDVIPVHYRSGPEVLSVVQHLLSPGGTATFSDRAHALIITGSEASIQRIRTFLETFDTAPQQVRIRLKFGEVQTSGERSVSGQGRVSGDGWSISTGGKAQDGVDLRVEDRERRYRQTREHVLVTTSGTPAYIFTGIEIPHRRRWADLCRRYAACIDAVDYRRVETGMEILPKVVGNRANVEIIPRVSGVDARDPSGVVRFTQASTRLWVPLGRWVDIGGTQTGGHEVLSTILGGSGSREKASLSLSLMVEAF